NFEAGRKVKAVEIRQLAELVRNRYELDIKIWQLRDAQHHDRPVIKEIMRRSDATLIKIRHTIESWDRRDIFDSDDDWAKFKDIQFRVTTGRKRIWTENPPWNDAGRA
ncbi:hypothetical protein GP486_007831, partial [Trichoglossum hirsutum]